LLLIVKLNLKDIVTKIGQDALTQENLTLDTSFILIIYLYLGNLRSLQFQEVLLKINTKPWLQPLINLKVNYKSPTLLYCNNQSAIQIVFNQVLHQRTKYIEIDSHIVQEKVNPNILKLLSISSHL